MDMPVVPCDQVLKGEFSLALDHPLAYFKDYLEHGYYPFAKDSDFRIRRQQIIEQTIENDNPYYANLHVSTARKLKHLLTIIAQSVPFKPQVKDYLFYMEKTQILSSLVP